MTQANITYYLDDELSLRVFNDEGLYNIRHESAEINAAINELFICNDTQLRVLMEDLTADLVEAV